MSMTVKSLQIYVSYIWTKQSACRKDTHYSNLRQKEERYRDTPKDSFHTVIAEDDSSS